MFLLVVHMLKAMAAVLRVRVSRTMAGNMSLASNPS